MVKGNGMPADEALFQRFKIQLQHLPSVNPDSANSAKVEFKAFLTQFEDQFTSEWSTEQLFGRMDPVRSFRGTQRVITLGFDVVAAGVAEAKHNLETCSTLLSMLYPKYSNHEASAPAGTPPQFDANVDEIVKARKDNGMPFQNSATILAAPLFRLKFANLIQSAKANPNSSNDISDGLIGSIDGLTYSPDIEQGFFDPKGEGNNSILYPQTIKLSFSFYVAHEHNLGWNQQNQFRNPGDISFPYPKSKKGGAE